MDQGTLTVSDQDHDRRLRHGQPALGRKALEQWARPRDHSDAGEVRAADSADPARRRAFPSDERNRELGLDELIAERRDDGEPLLGICLGMQLLFESPTEQGGAEGARAARGGGGRNSRPEGSRCRTSVGRRSAASAGGGTDRRDRGEEPVYLVHSFAAPPTPDEIIATASTAEVRLRDRRDKGFGAQFHPEKSRSPGSRMLPNFAGISASSGGGRTSRSDPLPGDRHPRRPRRAPPPRRLERETRVRSPIRRGRFRAGWSAGARILHIVDLDGARSGTPRSSSTVRADRHGDRGPSPARRRIAGPFESGRAPRSRRAPTAPCSEPRRFATRVLGTLAAGLPRTDDRLGRCPRRQGGDSRAGWRRRRRRDPRCRRGAGRAVVCTVRLHTVELNGVLEGPDSAELPELASLLPVRRADRLGGVGGSRGSRSARPGHAPPASAA